MSRFLRLNTFVGLGLLMALAAVLVGLMLAQPTVRAASPINEVDPSSLTCAGEITFDDVTGGTAPGTNFDSVFESDGADFAERFAGQALSFSGNFDVLSGTPTSPLTLQVGDPNDNLNVFLFTGTGSQVLTGLGPLGFPSGSAIGEGSFAVLFDFDQSEFGFDLVGGNAGSATVNFFKRDGSLIDTVILTGLSDQSYGFARDGGVNDVAGISVHNDDVAGIGFDNLCHDVAGVPGQPETVQCKDLGEEIVCISLDPKTGSNTVGDVHTVTATVTTDNPVAGTPVEGLDLYIFVIKGPNAGERIGPGLTDANGQVALTYTGDGGVGTDQMGTEACFNGCGSVDAFIDGCVENPDPCVDTFFNNPTCDGSVGDDFVCDFATKAWVAAAATPTSTPQPSPTSTPVPTEAAPAGLPPTGGTPSDGGSSALPWLATVVGGLALMGAGSGLWLARQRRRVR